MIQVNLLEQKKPLKMPVVMGVDLANLNIKALVVVCILFYVPDYTLKPTWEQELKDQGVQVEKLQKKLNKLNKSVKGHAVIKKQLAAFEKDRETWLKSGGEAVGEIDRNYDLAKFLPDDLEAVSKNQGLITGIGPQLMSMPEEDLGG